MFDLFGINFHWYGLLIGLGIWMAMEIALKFRGEIDKEKLEKAVLWSVAGGVLGARLYHVIDYWDRYYSINLVKILYFWEGGLGIWGAIVGGSIGLIIFSYFNKIKYLKLMDVLVIGMPLAQTVGRIGNFINGELYGKNGEPLFVYEGVLNLVLFVVLVKISKKANKIGMRSSVYLIGYGLIRILLENIRPTETIWKFQEVPVAIICGAISCLVGIALLFLQMLPPKSKYSTGA